MRAGDREVAVERMGILVESAVRLAGSDPRLAARHAAMARRISTRHRVRMPYRLRMVFCRRCKSFAPPGRGARFRVGGSPRSVRITCRLCGHTYRKVLPRGARPARVPDRPPRSPDRTSRTAATTD